MLFGMTSEVLIVWRERSELKRNRVPRIVSVECQVLFLLTQYRCQKKPEGEWLSRIT
jgi:hypothetical protein